MEHDVKDGTQSVVILEVEEVAETEVAWGLALTGYVLGKYPVYTPFLQFLKRLWRPPKGEILLTLQGNGFFIVRFNLEEDLLHALEDGPCSMDNRPFIIQRWSRDIRMEFKRLQSIPVWIASAIGTPLYFDTPTANEVFVSK
ncbi:hypothetical protein QJS10_CPB19g01417 [Acorus calamus]|uniref:DUF4283 domain-containing protein n=1 Tax=Acorus calamus TaxID=4465 RepID=A0AAV9CHH9_ACOCL|nr:hypothetical protein QJS10_CPB19g01417 [Acorus calamus]